MTTKTNPLASVIADLEAGRAKLAELPLEGSVLYCASGMALAFENDQPDGVRVCGLAFARIFTEAERGLGKHNYIHPILQRAYANGANEKFHLRSLASARRDAIDRMDKVIAELRTQLDIAGA